MRKMTAVVVAVLKMVDAVAGAIMANATAVVKMANAAVDANNI